MKCKKCGKSIDKRNKSKTCKICLCKQRAFNSRGVSLKANVTHGMCQTRFYKIYRGILNRCNNPKLYNFSRYGGRGIKCLWSSFENFRDDMYIDYLQHTKKFGEKNTTINRKDNDGNYCKKNCLWATSKKQANNRRSNRIINYKNKRLTLNEWSELLNINRNVFLRKLKKEKLI